MRSSKVSEKTQVSRIPILKKGNKVLSQPKEKAEALSRQYDSVFTDEPAGLLPTYNSVGPANKMPPIVFAETGVMKLINKLDASKARGPDNIPTRVLKETAEIVAPVLTEIFQKSYDTAIVPEDWKKASINAIYKKGDKTSPANYRPVSLTSVSCKMMEHIIHSSVMKHLNANSILVNYQHGFRTGHSCDTQLIQTIDDFSKTIDDKYQTDVIILDFSKAFDTVPHRRLLQKLERYGLDHSCLNWIAEWLNQRTQVVVLDGEQSGAVNVRSGVPQGTVLGPLLFLLYINDIGSNISSTIKLFADDCLLYRRIETTNDTDLLQEDLEKLSDWSKLWLMNFNVKKCNSMSITTKKKVLTPHEPYNISGSALERVSEATYLGVIISANLSWKKHQSMTISKATSSLHFLRRNLRYCDEVTKERAYLSLIRPVLEYACSAWDPHYNCDVQSVEMCQRRAARFVKGNYSRYASVTTMLDSLQWPSLAERRRNARLTHLYKAVNGNSGLQLPMYVKGSTRDETKFIQPQCRTEIHKNSFFPRTIKQWNALPERQFSSIDCFKASLDIRSGLSSVAPRSDDNLRLL